MTDEPVRRYYVPLSLDSFPTDVVRAADYDAALARVKELEGTLGRIADDARYLAYDTGDCTFEALCENRNIARSALAKEGK